MKYCIYLRKSRSDIEAELKGEGETLERHKKTLLELAKKNNLCITEVYSEIVSGETIAARPVMQKLLQEVEQGAWDGVLVMEVERLARGDTIDQGIVSQAFKYSNTKIITPLKVYDPLNEFDEEYFEFGLFMSRREYKVTNRRLQRGRITSVKEGKYVGNKAPYGYIRKKLYKDKGYTLEINPDEAEIVKIIFRLFIYGENDKKLGISLIAKKLNELKIPPQQKDVWTYSTIKNILTNPVYIGKIRWNSRPQVKKVVDGKIVKERPRAKIEDWILSDGLHDPIIQEEDYYKAQSMFNTNSPKCPKKYPVKNPLSGLIICGFCGRNMVRRPHPNGPDTLMCPIPACGNVSSILSLVETKLIQSLELWFANYKFETSKSINDISNSYGQDIYRLKKDALKKIEIEIVSTEKQINSIHDFLEKGIYDLDTFLNRSNVLSEKLNELTTQKSKIIKDISTMNQQSESTLIIIPKIRKVIDMYKATEDPELKNQLLKQLVSKATYTKKKPTRWHGDPTDFELVLYPKLPKD
ncbi:recombinase family protein [Ruminiclostridium josui]|uniref:recombinase family protein n=1 Tax=Ruminiclostridium josui TaxID=1499 RepID=UPI000463E93C|nr:recombinase family protein [Ruminiclostridium josui]